MVMPNDEPAKFEFGLYDNFLKMGLISLVLSFVMFSFVMRSAIARWLKREKNSNIAFRRNKTRATVKANAAKR